MFDESYTQLCFVHDYHLYIYIKDVIVSYVSMYMLTIKHVSFLYVLDRPAVQCVRGIALLIVRFYIVRLNSIAGNIVLAVRESMYM